MRPVTLPGSAYEVQKGKLGYLVCYSPVSFFSRKKRKENF